MSLEQTPFARTIAEPDAPAIEPEIDAADDTELEYEPEAVVEPALIIPRWESMAVFLLTFAVLALLTPHMTRQLTPLTGDEPFYLMTTISILNDGDLNECNNYYKYDVQQLYPRFYHEVALTGKYVEQDDLPQDWLGWPAGVPYPIAPHPAQLVPASRMCYVDKPAAGEKAGFRGRDKELYSKHGLGLSLLVLPAFLVGNELGGYDGMRLAVTLFLNLIAAMVALNIYLLARESTRRRWPAILTWLAFSFTIPLFAYAFLLFPELPAALLIIYAFRRLRLWGENNQLQLLLVGLSIAFLPWLHYRFVPVCVGLFGFYLYLEWRQRSNRRWQNAALLTVPSVISAGLLMLFFYLRYQFPLPSGDDHAGFNDLQGTLRGAVGVFIDQQWGLLVAAPIFVLPLVGLFFLAHERRRRDLLAIAAITLPYFLVVANYAQWWGEWCPPARYIMSILPLFALPCAVLLDHFEGWYVAGIATLYGGLLAISGVIAYAFMEAPQRMYNQPITPFRGSSNLLDVFRADTGYDLSSALPSFVQPYFAAYYDRTYDTDTFATSVNQAWQQSLLPIMIFLLLAVVVLLLANHQEMNRRFVEEYVVEEAA